jgi:hypothetical protein
VGAPIVALRIQTQGIPTTFFFLSFRGHDLFSYAKVIPNVEFSVFSLTPLDNIKVILQIHEKDDTCEYFNKNSNTTNNLLIC